MKTIISASRSVADPKEITEAILWSGFKPTTVNIGCDEDFASKGFDREIVKWAEDRALPVCLYSADWNHHGNGAIHRRNMDMLRHSDCLIAIFDNADKHIDRLLSLARQAGLKTYVHLVEDEL